MMRAGENTSKASREKNIAMFIENGTLMQNK